MDEKELEAARIKIESSADPDENGMDCPVIWGDSYPIDGKETECVWYPAGRVWYGKASGEVVCTDYHLGYLKEQAEKCSE